MGTIKPQGLSTMGALKKGQIIESIADITEAGVYSGTDIPDAPISSGEIEIVAFEAASGNLVLYCLNTTPSLHVAVKVPGNVPVWGEVTVSNP